MVALIILCVAHLHVVHFMYVHQTTIKKDFTKDNIENRMCFIESARVCIVYPDLRHYITGSGYV